MNMKQNSMKKYRCLIQKNKIIYFYFLYHRMLAKDIAGNIVGVPHKCNFNIPEDVLSRFPKKKIYIDGVEHVMYDLWDRDPEADDWEPLMAQIGDVLSEYVDEANNMKMLSEELYENLCNTVISLHSTYTRIWDTYNAVEIMDRIRRRFRDYKASEESKILFEKYSDKFKVYTKPLAMLIDGIRVKKGFKKNYENEYY